MTFDVSATAIDPNGINGVAPSGVSSIEIFVAVNDGAFDYWTTVPASNPVATYTAESNQTIWFISVAIDNAGNREAFTAIPDTYTYVSDFDAPVTQVNELTSDAQTGLIAVDFGGDDVGGSGLKDFDIYVKVDGDTPELIATVPAGFGSIGGGQSGTINYQGISDGQSHTYTFFSVGTDFKNNVELPPPGAEEDKTMVATFSQTQLPEVTAIDVQDGANQRSFVRYVNITFNTNDAAVLNGLIANDGIRLERFGIDTSVPTPGTGTNVNLSSASLMVFGNQVRIDFGANGIGGNRNSRIGDGFYQLTFDLDGDSDFGDARMGFFRLFGDANGDGRVDSADMAVVMNDYGRRGSNLEGDINGDGVVNIYDRRYTGREIRLGKALNSNLFNYIND